MKNTCVYILPLTSVKDWILVFHQILKPEKKSQAVFLLVKYLYVASEQSFLAHFKPGKFSVYISSGLSVYNITVTTSCYKLLAQI